MTPRNPADRPATEPRTEAASSLLAHVELLYDRVEAPSSSDVAAFYGWVAGIEAEAAQGAAPRAEGLDVRLRLAAERVIASFDWEEGPLPIITDDALAFGNAVNRLRDALASRPSDERVPESEEPLVSEETIREMRDLEPLDDWLGRMRRKRGDR